MMWLIITWGFIGIASWVWLVRSTGGGPIDGRDVTALVIATLIGPFALPLVWWDIQKNKGTKEPLP